MKNALLALLLAIGAMGVWFLLESGWLDKYLIGPIFYGLIILFVISIIFLAIGAVISGMEIAATGNLAVGAILCFIGVFVLCLFLFRK
jgi:hypothetical protein